MDNIYQEQLQEFLVKKEKPEILQKTQQIQEL